MGKHALDNIITDWTQVLQTFTPAIREKLRRFAVERKADLATYFYEQMLADPVAEQFLSHDQVKLRLHAAMQRWIERLFSHGPADDLAELVEFQAHIGDVHARIELPLYLVLRGARMLKRRSYALIQADPVFEPHEKMEAGRLVSGCVELAMEAMSSAYGLSRDRNSRAEESYRLFSISQNIAAERERQRASLLDWENTLMFNLAVGRGDAAVPQLTSTEFGMWFRHKGAHAFEEAPDTRLILEGMDRTDAALQAIAALEPDQAEERVRILRNIHETTREIEFHLDRLFEQQSELEVGRDELTRLLNRRFLPVVFNREINYSRRSGAPFGVLAIDVDHFKAVNDTYGHEGGDAVLQQLAGLLSNNVRGGDYLFRLGGEEFLVLLVDADPAAVLRTARKLCREVAQEPFRLPGDKSLNVTISVGTAMFCGHPDYMELLRRADDALYRAKDAGRNCVVSADDPEPPRSACPRKNPH